MFSGGIEMDYWAKNELMFHYMLPKKGNKFLKENFWNFQGSFININYYVFLTLKEVQLHVSLWVVYKYEVILFLLLLSFIKYLGENPFY